MVAAYLGGPMRNHKDFNFPAFLDGAKRLRDRGYTVFNPVDAEIGQGFDGRGHDGHLETFSRETGFDIRKALHTDLTWICQEADMVIVLPGWENSPGTRAEVATATALGLPVISLEKALIRHPPYKDDYLVIDRKCLAFRDLGSIAEVDAHLDENCGDAYLDQHLAQDWARVAKACEEAGETVKAYIAYTGQNPRKGKSGTLGEVLEELADTAFSAIFGIQHFTKDVDITAEILEEQLQKAVARVHGSKK